MTLPFSYKQRGFSLVELMVALTIGLLVTLAIGSLFVTTRQDYKQNDSTAKMQENARFALELIASDLRHAGYFGSIPDPTGVNVDVMNPTATTEDCGPKTTTNKPGLYNFTQTNLVMSFGNQIADAGSATFFGTCLEAADNVKPNSSVLIIKRVDGKPTAPLLADDPSTTYNDKTTDNRKNGVPYVYSNGGEAFLYTHPSTVALPIANGLHWEYQPRIYFIDTNNQLRRKMLSGLSLVSEPLADGIEAFHVEYGIDTMPDGSYDGVPAYFYTPAVNSSPDTATVLNQAVSATIFVLARTTDPDPDTKYKDDKSFQLGSTGPAIAAANDRFHRRVYSMTVMLKNIRNQVMSR